jgi:hypothetical protein
MSDFRDELIDHLNAPREWAETQTTSQLFHLALQMEFHRAFDCAEVSLRETIIEACKEARKKATQ